MNAVSLIQTKPPQNPVFVTLTSEMGLIDKLRKANVQKKRNLLFSHTVNGIFFLVSRTNEPLPALVTNFQITRNSQLHSKVQGTFYMYNVAIQMLSYDFCVILGAKIYLVTLNTI